MADAARGLVAAIFLPRPEEVARTGWEMAHDGSLWMNIAASLGRVLAGRSWSASRSRSAPASSSGLNRRLAVVLEPVAGFFNALSGIAWLPLAITWFGLGWASVTFIMLNTVFFLVFFNTLVGVRTVPRVVRARGAHARRLAPAPDLPGADPGRACRASWPASACASASAGAR